MIIELATPWWFWLALALFLASGIGFFTLAAAHTLHLLTERKPKPTTYHPPYAGGYRR